MNHRVEPLGLDEGKVFFACEASWEKTLNSGSSSKGGGW